MCMCYYPQMPTTWHHKIDNKNICKNTFPKAIIQGKMCDASIQ